MTTPSEAFLWVKALHLIAVICWFAALFYLPRLYVYHAMSEDEISHQRFQIMERKLYRGIMWPAMIATLVSAHFLVSLGDATQHYHQAHWFYLKVALVGVLIIYHLSCGYYRKKLITNAHYKSHKFWRFFNEFPTIILLAVVILVVVKPQF
ncbi:protoporphyrinogen oxidase HemJ [Acinetobacter sp. MD2]|uniref:protoporphyrinogen oxidase HemJ n=1 Tax=Acinetobacter sp. MD2 TaxID=2600066 RepID=UPI002D1F4933|nr:protoporphyrinogen oxidase HemJ [Acinetobacter sp. MD2]MEB3768072.1 protoporphyrinogen oxidase HemJ [Acinetobacter sp. MD2]